MPAPKPSPGSVFINCPFDSDFRPLFEAMVFTILSLGLQPRFSLERADSGEIRLRKIIGLIRQSCFGIHDLSRCVAKSAGEHYRLNMPLELGFDLAAKEFGGSRYSEKKILVLEEKRHAVKAAASDLGGCDGDAHEGEAVKMVKAVRNWLVQEANTPDFAAADIWKVYTLGFQPWNVEDLLKKRWEIADIYEMPMKELANRMSKWLTAESRY